MSVQKLEIYPDPYSTYSTNSYSNLGLISFNILHPYMFTHISDFFVRKRFAVCKESALTDGVSDQFLWIPELQWILIFHIFMCVQAHAR